MPLWSRIFTLAVLIIWTGQNASAHPHVFAEARLEVITNQQNAVAELRHVWRFDELFSSSVLLDFDSNSDLKLDRQELIEIGNVVRESLAEFDYYTSIEHNGQNVPILPPSEILVDFKDGQLLMFFAVAPAGLLNLDGSLSFGVFDPTMYASLDFIDDNDMVIQGPTPTKCQSEVYRPNVDEVIAENQASLTEAFYDTNDTNDVSRLFATRLRISC